MPVAGDEGGLAEQVRELLDIQNRQAEQIDQLQRELAALREGQTGLEEAQTALKEESAGPDDLLSWAKRVKFHGDLRYRHEYIDAEHLKDRTRHRIRARLGASAKLSETVDVAIQLATGCDDPVSRNQTLDGAFAAKDVWIDLAYFDWHPETPEGLHVIGGKMKNPFYVPGKSELIWDHDLNPEGLAVTYRDTWDRVDCFGNLGGFWVDENGCGGDTCLYGAQIGAKYNITDTVSVLGGVGVFKYDHTRCRGVFHEDFFGNSTRLTDYSDPDSVRLYVEDYTELELFAEVGLKVGGIPVCLVGDYVENLDADDDKVGWLLGITLGKCKDKGSWEGRYCYRELERDAVFGVFTDSDFIGGGTDGQGHEINLGYQLSKRVKLGATYFITAAGLDGPSHDYDRLQLDAEFKF